MSRLPVLDEQSLDSDQAKVVEAIRRGPRGPNANATVGPFGVWLRSPAFATPAQELGAHCRFGAALPRDVSEFAIILTAKHWRAQFEFWAHARIALEEGIPEEVVEAVRIGEPLVLERTDLALVHRLVTEYFATNRVSQETYQEALNTFGETGLVDLVGTVGYYGLVSATLNVFEVQVPAGEEEPLP
tara:strand:- start:68 stop:628 length:561 start_codon:yes stop_codon:yes gene_type:complete